jgi:hypothetical protein
MTVSTGDVLRITAVLENTRGVTFENVYHVKADAVIDGGDNAVMIEMASWLDDAYTEIQDPIANECSFVEVRGHDETTNQPLPAQPWPTLTVGGAATSSYADGVAALVLFRTTAIKVLGRKFLGPFTEDAFDEGLLTAIVIAKVVTFAGKILTSFAGATTLNQYHYGVYDKGAALRTVTSIVASAVPAYQRRRRPGRGI